MLAVDYNLFRTYFYHYLDFIQSELAFKALKKREMFKGYVDIIKGLKG